MSQLSGFHDRTFQSYNHITEFTSDLSQTNKMLATIAALCEQTVGQLILLFDTLVFLYYVAFLPLRPACAACHQKVFTVVLPCNRCRYCPTCLNDIALSLAAPTTISGPSTAAVSSKSPCALSSTLFLKIQLDWLGDVLLSGVVVRVSIFTVLMRSVWCRRLRRIRSLLLVVSVVGRLVGDVRMLVMMVCAEGMLVL
jgi:hypothetical protein